MDLLIERKLNQRVVPFYITKGELQSIMMRMDINWGEARLSAEECLRKFGDNKAVYVVEIEEGGFVRGEFERQLKVYVVDVSHRMASYHLQNQGT
jgi:hypothetical protein